MTHDFGVFIAPTASGDPDKLAAASGLSRADAKMLLVSKLPRRVTLEPTAEAATSRARALKDAGFDAFVVSRSALAKSPPRAKIFSVDGGSLVFDVLRFAPGELKLVVEGELQRTTEEQETDRVEDGGRVIREVVDRSRRSDAEPFFHLYGDSYRKAVEIRPRGFNFRALGKDFAPTMAMNAARFLALLRSLFPAAVQDDRLRRYPPFPDEGIFAYDEAGMDADRERKVRKDDNEKAALATSQLIAIHALRE